MNTEPIKNELYLVNEVFRNNIFFYYSSLSEDDKKMAATDIFVFEKTCKELFSLISNNQNFSSSIEDLELDIDIGNDTFYWFEDRDKIIHNDDSYLYDDIEYIITKKISVLSSNKSIKEIEFNLKNKEIEIKKAQEYKKTLIEICRKYQKYL